MTPITPVALAFTLIAALSANKNGDLLSGAASGDVVRSRRPLTCLNDGDEVMLNHRVAHCDKQLGQLANDALRQRHRVRYERRIERDRAGSRRRGKRADETRPSSAQQSATSQGQTRAEHACPEVRADRPDKTATRVSGAWRQGRGEPSDA